MPPLLEGKMVVPVGPPSDGKQVVESTVFSKTSIPVPIEFFNDTGVPIPKGKFINALGANTTLGISNGILADNRSVLTSSSIIGVTAQETPDGTPGVAYNEGLIETLNTDGETAGGLSYLGIDGGVTEEKPNYPANVVIVGSVSKVSPTEGVRLVKVTPFNRRNTDRGATFTSQGIIAGIEYALGNYDWSTTSANLSNSNLSAQHGVVGRSVSAHASIVAGGPGSVTGGVVGLQVVGTRDYEEGGSQSPSYVANISEDITQFEANTYYETTEKFSGEVRYELYVVSGTPSVYNLDINYGFSKYEDFGDSDVTIRGFEALWKGNARDTSFNIELLHHKSVGWLYAETGFIPGNGTICERLVDQNVESDVDNGASGSWKRKNLDVFVASSGSEGILLRITTGANSTVQISNMTVTALSEEIT